MEGGRLQVLGERLWGVLPRDLRRRLVWSLGAKYTVGVCAVVLNERNEILLVCHRYRESSDWQLPGGYVRRGEALEAALLRELHEETGCHGEVITILSAGQSQPLHTDIGYLVRTAGSNLAALSHEILAAQFFARDRLPETLDPEFLPDIDKALSIARGSRA